MLNNNQKYKTEYLDQNRPIGEKEQYELYNNFIAQVEWVKREFDYSLFSMKRKCRYNLKKGDMFEIDWGFNINAEFSNRHYGVVLADSNEHNPLVLVCPLKTNHSGAHPRSDIDLGNLEGSKDGRTTLAIVNQIRTVDKVRLYTKQVINRDMEHEVNLKMPEAMVNKIIRAYHLLIDNKPFWLVN